MRLITRAEWGARPRGDGSITPFRPRGVAVHWEGAGWSWPWAHSTCDNKVRSIQAYHMDDRGWSDIAYNFLSCPHGYVFEGRGLNRRSAANGSWDANTYWYAVQCLWGTKSGSATADLLNAARDAIDYCRGKGGAGNELCGHRDLNQTDCPGNQLYAWAHAGAPRPSSPEDEMTPAQMQELKNYIDAAVAKGARAAARAVWDEQIPDVLSAESGDTIAARTHLTWMPKRVTDAMRAELQGGKPMPPPS